MRAGTPVAEHAAQRPALLSTSSAQANTGNTSFYPVDPRGLVVFDENIVPISPSGRWKPMVGVVEDSQRLRARNDSLRTMADATDGLAVVQAGDLSAGMQRIVEDLELVLPARLLLDSRPRRKIPPPHGACEAARRARARADRIPCGHSRRRGEGEGGGHSGRGSKTSRCARRGGEGLAVDAWHLLERAAAARARCERVPAIRRCDHLGRCGSPRHNRPARLD